MVDNMNYLKEPWKLCSALQRHGLGKLIPDKVFIKGLFHEKMGYKLNLNNPQTFNEKLQWLKLYDRNPLYTTMVDKYAVKKYVADRIGEEYIIPTLGVWEKFDDIDFDKLPDQFVLKCTHDSGGLVICKDKSKLDMKIAKEKIESSLKTDYYLLGREWPYKNVPRRIIAERYMEDTKTAELRDYKFFCFNGVVRCFKVDFGRSVEHHANYYSAEGDLLDLCEDVCPPVPDMNIDLPSEISKMKEIAQIISNHFDFVRIDFYFACGKIYFGEITFYPASGYGTFTPREWDNQMGDWLRLTR